MADFNSLKVYIGFKKSDLPKKKILVTKYKRTIINLLKNINKTLGKLTIEIVVLLGKQIT